MGAGEAAALSKSDKVSSPVQEQTTIYAHPDWTALQAYYGPGVSIPPSYYAAIASGHASPHPYMWGPQPMMSPYAMPYTAAYLHGVFPHPSVPLMVSPPSMATPEKLRSNRGKGLLKRFKRHDGTAVPAGSGTAENATGSIMPASLQSGEGGAEGSSSVSDGNSESEENNDTQRSSSSEDTLLISGKGEKSVALDNAIHGGVNSANTTTEPVGTISSSFPAPRTQGTIPANEQVQVRAAPVAPVTIAMVQGHDGVPMELWIQDESEVKRERRKQSNRDSARRSRLRKQAEAEELTLKAETLNVENRTLKCEIYRVKDNIEKLRRENSALKEKLKKAHPSQLEEISSVKIEPEEPLPVCTENLLSKLNNSSSRNSIGLRENDAYDNSKGRLRQFLDTSRRTDAVAAG